MKSEITHFMMRMNKVPFVLVDYFHSLKFLKIRLHGNTIVVKLWKGHILA